MRPHGLRLNSGVQGGGGGPVDCATNCAAELAAAEAAGEVTGNAEGRLARVLDWRNPGLFSTTPTQFDPSSLGTWSAPDISGIYTVTMLSGTAASTPATGSSLIWPCPMANGAAAALERVYGMVRVYTTYSTAAPVNSLRWWCVVMDDPDPTVALGWGVGGQLLTSGGSQKERNSHMYTTTAGTWAQSAAVDADFGRGWIYGGCSQQAVGIRTQLWSSKMRLDGSFQSNVANYVTNGVASITPPDFSGGAWICVGFGASDTALIAGNYTIRGHALLADFDFADEVGVGETP